MRLPRLSITLLATALASLACEREGTVIVEPGGAPGRSSETRETLVTPGMTEWVDSAFSGFAGPGNATFLELQEDASLLTSRGLIRFDFIEDSVFVLDTLSGTLRFDSVRIILDLDTTRTSLASTGTTVQLVDVTQGWDRGSANWENAVDSVGVAIPWTGGPGGSFGIPLGDTTLTELSDSVVIWLDVDTDSLLRDWLDTTTVNRGLGLMIGDSGRITLQLPRIQYNLIPEVEPDTFVGLRVLATDGTFIFDTPSSEPVAGVVRVGGVEGWRSFLGITIPDSVLDSDTGDPVAVRGATINRAELFLISLDPSPPPFGADQDITATAYELVDDFTVLGAKTPVSGLLVGSDVQIQVDSLTAGDTIMINVTRLVQRWANVPIDSAAQPLRVSIRGLFEATTFGYWQFGAADGDPQFTPALRIVFTRPTEFTLP